MYCFIVCFLISFLSSASQSFPVGSPMYSCVDSHISCGIWAVEGKCTSEPYFMLTNCPLSCNTCNATQDEIFLRTESYLTACQNYYTACTGWAEFNECKINPRAMLQYCPLSCDTCFRSNDDLNKLIEKYLNECEDDVENCQEISMKNECRISSFYALRFCRKTCGVCGLDTHQIRELANQYYYECEDYHESCSEWEKMNECKLNPGPMGRWCRKSCGTCQMSVEQIREWIIKTDNECEDDYEECEQWGKDHCSTNPKIMLRFCRKTCGTCQLTSQQISEQIQQSNPACVDQYEQCPDWAMMNECKINPYTVLNVCKKSCGTCHLLDSELTQLAESYASNCQDDHPNCAAWARNQECQKNPQTMLRHCRNSCGTCYKTTHEIAHQIKEVLTAMSGNL